MMISWYVDRKGLRSRIGALALKNCAPCLQQSASAVSRSERVGNKKTYQRTIPQKTVIVHFKCGKGVQASDIGYQVSDEKPQGALNLPSISRRCVRGGKWRPLPQQTFALRLERFFLPLWIASGRYGCD
ncbi:MAG: hypothetical protein LBC37_01035 [Zoogloeaceae bacterium]|jgi:hypothetical protein|nr:hypothetical protein [Zoogloeaceae bacterium]